MSNGGNGLPGISRINSFSSLMILAGKYHLRSSTKVLKCFSSAGLAQKWSSVSTLPSISKRMWFFLLWGIIYFLLLSISRNTLHQKGQDLILIYTSIFLFSLWLLAKYSSIHDYRSWVDGSCSICKYYKAYRLISYIVVYSELLFLYQIFLCGFHN